MAFERAKRDVRLRCVGFKKNDKTSLLLWQKLADRIQARLPENGRILIDSWVLVAGRWFAKAGAGWRACGRPYLTDSGSGALQSMSILRTRSRQLHRPSSSLLLPFTTVASYYRPVRLSSIDCCRFLTSLRVYCRLIARVATFLSKGKELAHKVQGKQERDEHTRPARN
jgi:hypothetical protein